MKTANLKVGTRQRLIAAMADLLQRKGLHGIGLSEVLAKAQAPKGVLYHHFPGGKVELAIAAIQTSISRIALSLEQSSTTNQSVVQALRSWLEKSQKRLEKSGFELGCPLATVALESTATDRALRKALQEGFSALRSALTRMLVKAGMKAARAAQFSTLIVSAYEGALLQSRVACSEKPASETMELLLQLLQLEIESTRG